MISDKYQGVIVYLILKDLISEGELFGGESSPRFDDFKEFSTQRLSTMEGWYALSNIIIALLLLLLLGRKNCFDLLPTVL